MKRNWFSPVKALTLGTAIAGCVLFSSCDKDNDKPANHNFTVSGNASSSQVVPPYTGTGTGTIAGTYNDESNQLNYEINWNGLTDSASTVGIYTGATGAAGTPVQDITVTTPGSTGKSTGTLSLTDAQETDLKNGNMYYSVGTVANPNGEIRGQISVTQ